MYHSGHFITCPWRLSSSVVGLVGLWVTAHLCPMKFWTWTWQYILHLIIPGGLDMSSYTLPAGNVIWPNGWGQRQFSQYRKSHTPGHANSEMIHNDPNSYHRSISTPVLCQAYVGMCACVCGDRCVLQRSTCCKEENRYPKCLPRENLTMAIITNRPASVYMSTLSSLKLYNLTQ